jgi:NMD protein affecting ribosome stability and mRNA decay
MEIKEIIDRLKGCLTPYGAGSRWYDTDSVNDLIKDLEQAYNSGNTTCPECGGEKEDQSHYMCHSCFHGMY